MRTWLVELLNGIPCCDKTFIVGMVDEMAVLLIKGTREEHRCLLIVGDVLSIEC